ncbi:MAG: hypothetical protein WEA11_04925 [Acidimicrobiales bacterium]
MIVVFIILSAFAVVAIGLVAVGRLAGELAEQPRPAVYDRAEAVAYVAEVLPDDVTARLTFEELAQLLQWHLDYLEELGVARAQGVEHVASGPLVAAEDDALAFVLGRATDAGLDIDDVSVVKVIEGNEKYLEAIGAIGSQLAMPEDPTIV